MHNTMWAAVAGSIFQMRQMDVIANNLANANTPGFRGDRMDFSTYLNQIQDPQFSRYRDSVDQLSDQMRTMTDFEQGPMMNTGNPLDMAINGSGFFVIQTPEGPLYTRAGNFQLDQEGNLITKDGYLVQGDGGALQIREGLPFELDDQGSIYQEGDEVGKLRVVEISNPETLQKISGERFKPSQETKIIVPEEPAVLQRTLETSNVNPVREMTLMLQAGRAFDSYQQVIRMVNTINQQANRELGSFSQ